MIFVTGDIHGDPRRFSTTSFFEQKEMTKNDYVIILGDFGLIWNQKEENANEKNWLDWLEKKPFTTLFIDGNHENYDRLDAYPISEWHGGRVQHIRPSVIHLMRGQVFEIDGATFFAFGGASSHDIRDGILEKDDPRIKEWRRDYTKMFRVNHVSWWKRELPSKEEMEEGWKNLAAAGNKVDFILTHCTATSTAALMSHGVYKPDYLTDYLEEVRSKAEFKRWFFGHYHDNCAVNEKEIMLFEQIVRIW